MSIKKLYDQFFGLDYFLVEDKGFSRTLRISGMALSTIAILFSAFHFWPFANSKIWQLICLPNLAVLIWITILTGYFIYRRGKWKNATLLPHISVFTYLALNILSIAFANDAGRSINFTLKLLLMLIGGYTLFSAAITGNITLRLIYIFVAIAATISIVYCFLSRFLFGSETFGFFDNSYKYGTYIGILVPMSISYLFLSPQRSCWILAVIFIITAILTCGSLGGIAAIICGIIVLSIIIRGWLPRIVLFFSLLVGIGLTIVLSNYTAVVPLLNDVKLLEANNVDLKQRYIEWQAELNILEERAIPGTAAGSINDYRSSFYYRLPKLNTLKAFDQNGWLATGAETGLLGFVCFCWMNVYYFKLAFRQLISTRKVVSSETCRYSLINFVSLISAFVANIFSSVHYNGVLIIYVLILVLISRTNIIYEEQHEHKTNI